MQQSLPAAGTSASLEWIIVSPEMTLMIGHGPAEPEACRRMRGREAMRSTLWQRVATAVLTGVMVAGLVAVAAGENPWGGMPVQP